MIYLILYAFLGIHSVNLLSFSEHHCTFSDIGKKFSMCQYFGANSLISSGMHRIVSVFGGDNFSYKGRFLAHHEAKKISFDESFAESDPLFEGVHKVHVSLEPKSIPAKMIAMFVKPQGDSYIKLTPLEDGSIRIQFCDAEGNVRVSPINGTGFSAGSMPKRLYLTDVRFRYKDGRIIDAQNGKNKVKVLPCSDCSGKVKQWTEDQVRDKTKSSDRAVILPKMYSGILEIEIKLNLSVAFNAVIKEVK